MLKEASSYDTIGNGFFALTIHAIPAAWRHATRQPYTLSPAARGAPLVLDLGTQSDEGQMMWLSCGGGRGCRRLAVVTSDFHMPRSKSIFQVTAALAGSSLWQDPERRAPPPSISLLHCVLDLPVAFQAV